MRVLLLALCVALSACSVQKVEPAKKATPSIADLSPEQLEKAFVEGSKLTKEHALLNKFVGSWKTKTTFWMDPSKPPEVSNGTAQIKPILGGHYIKGEVKGKSMGQTFEGVMIAGYDTVLNQFHSYWIDSMMNAPLYERGAFDETTQAITWDSEVSCPLTSGKRTGKSVTKFLNDRTIVYEMYDTKPNGESAKVIEVVYSRSKR